MPGARDIKDNEGMGPGHREVTGKIGAGPGGRPTALSTLQCWGPRQVGGEPELSSHYRWTLRI